MVLCSRTAVSHRRSSRDSPAAIGRFGIRPSSAPCPTATSGPCAFQSGRDATSHPLGARIALPEIDTAMWGAHQRGAEPWATVVGVVGAIREVELGVPPQPTAYLARGQNADWHWYGTIIARSSAPPAVASGQLTRAAKSMNPASPATVSTVNDSIIGSVVAPRVRAFVLAAFAALALVLASIGVYGVTAHVTAQRTPEIGIRMA